MGRGKRKMGKGEGEGEMDNGGKRKCEMGYLARTPMDFTKINK